MTYKTLVAKSERGAPAPWFGLGPVTALIIASNLAIFVGEVAASKSVDAIVNVPLRVCLAFGANYAPLTLGLGQYDRLLAHCFVHGSILHVGMNMYVLRQLGPFVERMVGSARYAILYVLSGIGGGVASVVWGLIHDTSVPSVGASGAICGVMGAALVLGLRLEGWKSGGIARQIAFWLVIMVAMGLSLKNIDNGAHLGGVVTGSAIAALWRRGVAYSPATTFACVAVSILACLASGAATAYRDATDSFAQLGPNERTHRVQEALKRGDCAMARRALVAAEAVKGDDSSVHGLRTQVDNACPPGT
jgi:rhomboid protease GluP